jgi:hypothetical protein
MLGQPWALLDRRALSSSHQEKSWLRASNHIPVTWRIRELGSRRLSVTEALSEAGGALQTGK